MQSHNSALLLFPAEVLILSLTSIDFLKLNLDKAFQLILHFFARISAQPQLWIIREKYINLIADIKDSLLTDIEIRNQRDSLVTQLGAIYQEAPDTRPKAYKAAQKALKINQEMTFSSDEIDLFLPVYLREKKTTP